MSRPSLNSFLKIYKPTKKLTATKCQDKHSQTGYQKSGSAKQLHSTCSLFHMIRMVDKFVKYTYMWEYALNIKPSYKHNSYIVTYSIYLDCNLVIMFLPSPPCFASWASWSAFGPGTHHNICGTLLTASVCLLQRPWPTAADAFSPELLAVEEKMQYFCAHSLMKQDRYDFPFFHSISFF